LGGSHGLQQAHADCLRKGCDVENTKKFQTEGLFKIETNLW